jgi:RND family efflux transporter MFP subunit
MSDTDPPDTRQSLNPSRKRTLLVCIAILAVAALIALAIFSTEPGAQKESAVRKSAMLAETITVHKGTFRPWIVETGVVTPSREIQLSAQVEGRIIEIHEEFIPGGYLNKGDVAVKIEAADYENLLLLRKSELLEAESDLKLEMGRQTVARRDLALFESEMPPGSASLVLREPQLAAARSRVDAAKAALRQAQLELDRTLVKAPFDAQVIRRDANLGSQISTGQPLAQLIGTDTYWVIATVAMAKIPYLQFPDSVHEGAEVRLHNRSAWPEATIRTGRLFRLVGALEETTRLARIVIVVSDPLSREQASSSMPPLLVGEYLEVKIQGKPIENVDRLEREYLRKNNTAWVMDTEGKLQIRKLDIVFQDARYAYVRSGLDGNEAVVTTNLASVFEGAALRKENKR